MVGYAATVKIRGSAPPTAGARYPDRTRLVGLHRARCRRRASS